MQLKRKDENDYSMSEKEYRGIKDVLSYSGIKKFDEDRKKFYEEFILGKQPKDKETLSKVMGSLVHSYLARQNFDEKFHMLSAIEPKGQMLTLTDNLYERTLKSVVYDEAQEKYIQGEKFEVLFSDAFDTTKFNYDGEAVAFKNKDLAKALEMFKDSDAEIYYREKMDNIGKMVVSTNTVTKAEDIERKLRGHSFTHEIANLETGEHVDVYHELAIFFEIAGVPYKSLVDKLAVDHESKTIQPYDWKTSWDNEEPERAYLKFGYYLQAAMYDKAVKFWAQQQGYGEYTVLPMIFIFCDTSGWADPVVLRLKADDVERAKRGFKIRGYRYRGLNELMTDIAWHQETGNWATSKAISDNRGVINLELAYGSK